jgi:tetratricopeptide (TPR) repeat protein
MGYLADSEGRREDALAYWLQSDSTWHKYHAVHTPTPTSYWTEGKNSLYIAYWYRDCKRTEDAVIFAERAVHRLGQAAEIDQNGSRIRRYLLSQLVPCIEIAAAGSGTEPSHRIVQGFLQLAEREPQENSIPGDDLLLESMKLLGTLKRLYPGTQETPGDLSALQQKLRHIALGRFDSTTPLDSWKAFRLGESYYHEGRTDLALELFQRGVANEPSLLRSKSPSPKLLMSLVQCQFWVGKVQQEMGHSEEALAAFLKAAALAEQLENRIPEKGRLRSILAACWHTAGRHYTEKQQPKLAMIYLLKAKQLRETLCELEPDNPRHAKDLAGTLERLREAESLLAAQH